MKLLLRDKTSFEYLPYESLTEGIEDGLYTGVQEPKYGEPVPYKGNISVPSGYAVQAFDGIEVRYSHILIMDNPNADIRETGKILWNGKSYEITAVRKSMNVLSAALLEETTDYGDQLVTQEDETPEGDDQPEEPEGEP